MLDLTANWDCVHRIGFHNRADTSEGIMPYPLMLASIALAGAALALGLLLGLKARPAPVPVRVPAPRGEAASRPDRSKGR